MSVAGYSRAAETPGHGNEGRVLPGSSDSLLMTDTAVRDPVPTSSYTGRADCRRQSPLPSSHCCPFPDTLRGCSWAASTSTSSRCAAAPRRGLQQRRAPLVRSCPSSPLARAARSGNIFGSEGRGQSQRSINVPKQICSLCHMNTCNLGTVRSISLLLAPHKALRRGRVLLKIEVTCFFMSSARLLARHKRCA